MKQIILYHNFILCISFVIMQTNINTTFVIIIIYNHYDDYF